MRDNIWIGKDIGKNNIATCCSIVISDDSTMTDFPSHTFIVDNSSAWLADKPELLFLLNGEKEIVEGLNESLSVDRIRKIRSWVMRYIGEE